MHKFPFLCVHYVRYYVLLLVYLYERYKHTSTHIPTCKNGTYDGVPQLSIGDWACCDHPHVHCRSLWWLIIFRSWQAGLLGLFLPILRLLIYFFLPCSSWTSSAFQAGGIWPTLPHTAWMLLTLGSFLEPSPRRISSSLVLWNCCICFIAIILAIY